MNVATDPVVQQKAVAGAVAAASGAGSLIVTVKAWVLELFGIQLAVLLAAATGAFGARMLLPEAPFWRAVGASTFWMLAGGWCAEFARWGLGRWIEGGPPAAALSGIALVLAGLGQRFVPIVWESGGKALQRWFDGIGKRGGQ